MYGGSYVGATQMLAAIAHPPHLAGICPVVTASNYHDGWTYQGGAFEQWFNESWTSGLAQDTLNRFVRSHTNALNGIAKLPLTQYPLFELPQSIRPMQTCCILWLHIFSTGCPIRVMTNIGRAGPSRITIADIGVPSLTVAAWYDIFLGGSLRNYIGVKLHGKDEAARHGQHLLSYDRRPRRFQPQGRRYRFRSRRPV